MPHETAVSDAGRRLSSWRRRCGATAGGPRARPRTSAGRPQGTDPDAPFRRDERGHPVRAVRVVESQERQEGADDRDAARDRRNAHDDDAAERDRPGGGWRLHPARADGVQPAWLVRRSGAAGTPRRAACGEPSAQRRGGHPGAQRRGGSPGGAARHGCGTAAGATWSASTRSAEQPERSAQPARAE